MSIDPTAARVGGNRAARSHVLTKSVRAPTTSSTAGDHCVFEKFPGLHFELIDVFSGADSICIYYKSVLGLLAVEWFHFDHAGKVSKAIAHYNEFPK